MRMGTTLSVGGKGREPYSLAIVASGATGPGTYPVTDDLFAPRGADFALLDATTFVTTALNGSGSLTITSLSPVEAAGSFSFTAGQGSLVRQVSGDFTVAF
jgi:hypothetical protein